MQEHPVDIGRQTKRRHQNTVTSVGRFNGLIEAVKQIRSSSAVLATFKGSLYEAVAAALFLERSLQNQMRVVEGEERRRWLGARLNYSEETCQDVHASEYDRLTAGDVEKAQERLRPFSSS